jgi:hypothetical protein
MRFLTRLARRCTALFCAAALALALPVTAGAAELTPQETVAAAVLRTPLTNTAQAKSATVMVYMIGSDLESKTGLASADLEEMMAAELGENVNVIVQTMGTRQWVNPSIRSDTSQRFQIQNGKLKVLGKGLGQLDSTDPQTLTDFIQYCADTYPADRNMLILWDHGAGPIYGYGCDEHQGKNASLTLDEIRTALRDSKVTFDLVGMDACLMGSLETCCALWNYADYLCASEDFESSDGWEYTRWLTALGEKPSISTPDLGRIITEDFAKASSAAGEDGILALVDLAYTPLLSAGWARFGYEHDSALTSANYSWQATPSARSTEQSRWMFDRDSYYVTDVMAAANMVDTAGSDVLSSMLSDAIAACSSTQGNRYMTGLSVTLPYADSNFYQKMKVVLLNCGFDETYLEWLGTFADALDIGDNYYDHWEEWKEEWTGWEDYQQQRPSSPNWEKWLSDEKALAGQTMIDYDRQLSNTDTGLWHWDEENSIYTAQLSGGDRSFQDPSTNLWFYYKADDQSWWLWKGIRWEPCSDPGYPIN